MSEFFTRPLPLFFLKLLISLFAIGAIGARLFYPEVRIDAVTLGFIVLALIPWLTELIDTVKFPGGWEIKLRDLLQAGETVAGRSKKLPPNESDQLAFVSIAHQDPNLALVGLRIEIEKRIRRLAERHDVKADQALGRLLQVLRQREALPFDVAASLEELVAAGNRAAHGARVEPGVADWAFEFGPEILKALDQQLDGPKDAD